MPFPRRDFLAARHVGLLVVWLLSGSVAARPARAQQPIPAVSGSITFTQPLTRNAPGDLAQRIVVDPSGRTVAPWATVGFRWTWEAVAAQDAVYPVGGFGLRFRRPSLQVAVGVNLDAAYDRLGLDGSDSRILPPSPPSSDPQWPPHMPKLSDSIPGKGRGMYPDPIELTPTDVLGNARLTPAGTAGQARYAMQQVTDITAAADWNAGPVAVTLETGWRLTGPASRQLWYSARAAAPLLPMFAVVVGMDRRHDRLLSPNRTRMTLGVEWRKALLGRRSPAEPKRTRSDSVAPSGEGSFVVSQRPNGVTLSVLAAAANRVEVRSDLTGWTPVSMERGADGTWRLDLAATPGVHRLAMRIDGGAWRPPPGLPTGSDGYGGMVGLFVVGR